MLKPARSFNRRNERIAGSGAGPLRRHRYAHDRDSGSVPPRTGDSEATYRQAVTAFYVSLAAMQTSQDVLARQELERLVQLVPARRPAGPTSGCFCSGSSRWTKPANALRRRHRSRLETPQSNACWRSPQAEEAISTNRFAAGDARSSWTRTISERPTRSRSNWNASGAPRTKRRRSGCSKRWQPARKPRRAARARAHVGEARRRRRPRESARCAGATVILLAGRAARERLKAVRDAAQGSPTAATTPVIFLKNVLIAEPEYRAAFAEVSTPRSEVGEPVMRLITLRNPDAQPARPTSKSCSGRSIAAPCRGGCTLGRRGLADRRPPAASQPESRDLRLLSGAAMTFPAGAPSISPAPTLSPPPI